MRSIGFKSGAQTAQIANKSALREHLTSTSADGRSYASLDLGWQRIYGGQVIGQSIAAAGRKLKNDSQFVNSIRTRFVEMGDVNLPLAHEVTPLRLGKSFSWMNVNSTQSSSNKGESPVYTSAVSLKVKSDGPFLRHDHALSDNIVRSFLPPDESERISSSILGFEIRGTTSKESPTTRALWVRRVDCEIPWTSLEEQAALGYVSDFFFLRSALHKHGLDFFDGNVRAASLCHSLFFHREVHLNDWVLFLAKSPFASSGRAIVEGQFINIRGERIASAIQEGLVWQKEKTSIIVSKPEQLSTKRKEKDHHRVLLHPKQSIVDLLNEGLHKKDSTGCALKDFGWHRVYGGQLLGQAIIASYKAIEQIENPDLFLHSFHGHFLKAGKIDKNNPTQYDAQLVRNGRVYTNLNLRATQENDMIFRADVSFAALPKDSSVGSGIEHDDDLDDIDYCRKRFKELPEIDRPDHGPKDLAMPFDQRRQFLSDLGIDFRQDFEIGAKVQRVFVKSAVKTGNGAMSQAVLAFAIDCLFPPAPILEHSPAMIMWGNKGNVGAASLCASLYFHRQFDIGEEFLTVRASSPIMVDSRALVKLDIFRDFGAERVATAYQEVLVRDRIEN